MLTAEHANTPLHQKFSFSHQSRAACRTSVHLKQMPGSFKLLSLQGENVYSSLMMNILRRRQEMRANPIRIRNGTPNNEVRTGE